MTKREYPPAEHLSERSKLLWRELVPRRAKSPERLALLRTALEAMDRSEAARAVLDEEGLTFASKTTGRAHLHPLVKVEQAARKQVVRIWDMLGLAWWHRIDGHVD